MKNKSKKTIATIITLIILILLIVVGYIFVGEYKKKQFKTDYDDMVLKYSDEYNVDKYLIYAVIKTESGFDTNAVSNQKARGLMQITEPTFDWLKTKLKDETTTFDDLFDPETNIKYGTFFVSYLMNEFGTVDVAMAAYHSGRGRVNEWLSNKEYSQDGIKLDIIPVSETAHYVTKINKNYNEYKKIYTK